MPLTPTQLTNLRTIARAAVQCELTTSIPADLTDEQREKALCSMSKTNLSGKPIRCIHVGKSFGRLRVLGVRYFDHDKNRYFVVVCDCGTVKLTQEPGVLSGHTISCGCFNREFNQARRKHDHSHAGARTVEYTAWLNIKARCYRPRSHYYKYYGGRGIKVCKRWLDSFADFLLDIGPKPKGPPKYTIERKDVNGDYTPDNCVWATYAVQSRNKRNSRRAVA